MPDRRGSRFILEVLFLLGLAVALTLAQLSPVAIAGLMLVGWVIVAALEWAAWRSEPHYGSGLPPRYYVPQVSLPPAQPLEQVSGYPEAQRDEAPTWIASAALRAEVLGEWPVAPPADEQEPEPVAARPEPLAETQPDPWTVVELPVAPLGEPEPEPVAEVEPEPVAEPEPEPALVEEPEPEPSLEVALVRSVQGVSRYHLDPLGDPPPRRRFGRNGADATLAVEVPARPEGIRALPGRSNSQD